MASLDLPPQNMLLGEQREYDRELNGAAPHSIALKSMKFEVN